MEFLKYCKNHFKYKFYKILLYGIIAFLLFNLLGCESVNAEIQTGEQYSEFATFKEPLLRINTSASSLTLYGYDNPSASPSLESFLDGRTPLVTYDYPTNDVYSHWAVSAYQQNLNPGTYFFSWKVTFTTSTYASQFCGTTANPDLGSVGKVNSFTCNYYGNDAYVAVNFNLTTSITESYLHFGYTGTGLSINWFRIRAAYVYYPSITPSVYLDTEGLEEQNEVIINQNTQTNQKLDGINSTLKETEETQKGIWETIKDLPNQFLEMLKSLFIPEDGYFEDWFNDLKSFFEEKLGFLATPFTIFIDFVNMYLNLDASADIIINIPNITVPNFEDKTIISATTFNWSQTLKSKEALYTLWQLYLAFIDVFLILNFLNFCESKYNRIFGGDTSNYEYYTVEDSITYDNNTGEVTGRRMNERTTTRKKVN